MITERAGRRVGLFVGHGNEVEADVAEHEGMGALLDDDLTIT
jgi:hypothetical protein